MMSLKYTDKSVSKNVRYKERKNMKKIEAIIRTDKLEDLKQPYQIMAWCMG